MRTVLTVLLAITLTLAFGVTSASADADLHVCTNKKATKFRLVEDAITECGTGEVGNVYTATRADSVTIIDSKTFIADRPNWNWVGCNVEDDRGQPIPSRRVLDGEMRILCPFGMISVLGTSFDSIEVRCKRWDTGQVTNPQELRITCTID